MRDRLLPLLLASDARNQSPSAAGVSRGDASERRAIGRAKMGSRAGYPPHWMLVLRRNGDYEGAQAFLARRALPKDQAERATPTMTAISADIRLLYSDRI